MASRTSKFAAVFLGLAVLAAGCGDLGKNGLLGPANGQDGKYFLIGVEQDGRRIPVRDHQVFVRRAPFAILVVMATEDTVLANASFSSQSFDAARTGAKGSPIPCFSGQAIKEGLFNQEHALVIGDGVFYRWQYYGPQNNRFDSVIQKDGANVCYRTIDKYNVVGDSNWYDIRGIDKPAIYFTFLMQEWNMSRNRPEKQRDWLMVTFQ